MNYTNDGIYETAPSIFLIFVAECSSFEPLSSVMKFIVRVYSFNKKINQCASASVSFTVSIPVL